MDTPTHGMTHEDSGRDGTPRDLGLVNRRKFVGWSLGTAAALATAGSCSSGSAAPPKTAAEENSVDEDFSSRFSGFEVADEPNGDLSKVVWPSFVTDADPEVRRLYEFQITHGELMRYMPCFCGCGQEAGHYNNRDCYVESVNADGSVVFDSMAPT